LTTKTEHSGFGVEGRAIVETHTFAKLEGVGETIRADCPRDGEARLDFGCALLKADEALTNIDENLYRLAIVNIGRVELLRIRTASENDDGERGLDRLPATAGKEGQN
jgi:hypothetical protein